MTSVDGRVTRNGHRLTATRHEHIRPGASVQPTGRECCLPSWSRKNTPVLGPSLAKRYERELLPDRGIMPPRIVLLDLSMEGIFRRHTMIR